MRLLAQKMTLKVSNILIIVSCESLSESDKNRVKHSNFQLSLATSGESSFKSSRRMAVMSSSGKRDSNPNSMSPQKKT